MARSFAILLFVSALIYPASQAIGQSDEARRHFDRGMAALELAKSPEDLNLAITEFKQATLLAPDWADAFYNLGKVQEAAEKYEEAIVSYREYLRHSSNVSDADEVKKLINKVEFKLESEQRSKGVYQMMTSENYQRKQVEHKKVSGSDGGYPLWSFRVVSGELQVRNIFGPSSNDYHPQQHPRIDREWEPVNVNGESYNYRYSHYMDMSNDYVVRFDIEVTGEIISVEPPRLKETVTYSVTWGAPIEGNRRPWSASDNFGGTSEYVFELTARAAGEIAKEAEKDPKIAVTNIEAIGNTSLYSAVSSGDLKLVETLIAKGADINSKDQTGRTPLHYAVLKDRKDMVERLIAKGADVNAKNAEGNTALEIAAHNGNKKIAEFLIGKGADLDNRNNEGGTALHTAIAMSSIPKSFSKCMEVFRLLIAKGSNVNVPGVLRMTPLHYAAYYGNKEAVELLIGQGADIHAKDGSGNTPQQVAESRKNTEIAEILKRLGAK